MLVGDDQEDVLEALRLALKSSGHRVRTVTTPEALVSAAANEAFDLILMDMNYKRDTTSGEEGLELLSRLRSQPHATPVVVMTAWGDVELAVEAMRRGAVDFVQKPWSNERLLATIARRAVRRHQSELEIAQRVQQKLLPEGRGQAGNLEYAGVCYPAREVGGDCFDFSLREGGIDFLLADVSGKGLPAALLMASLQASIRSQLADGSSICARVLNTVNRLFHASTAPEHYATLFAGSYNERSHLLRYVNCGHFAPVLVHPNGSCERLEPTATVLGAFPDWTCDEADLELGGGDVVAIFSDGVVEAGIHTNGAEFGEDRIISVVKASRHRSAAQIQEALVAAAQDFERGDQGDDLSVLVLKASSK